MIVPVGLTFILVPFSLLIGWNLLSMLLFWLVLAPGLAIYFPVLLSGNKNRLFKSVWGLTIFYAIMVFMIYDHYRTDFFKLMIWSGAINLVLVSVIWRVMKQRSQTE